MEEKIQTEYSNYSLFNSFLLKFHKLDPEFKLFIIAVFVGIIGGLSAVIFRFLIWLVYYLLIELPITLFEGILPGWIIILIVPAFCGGLVGLITTKVASESKGHGIPEIILAVENNEGKIRMRVPFAKLFASALSIGSGGSAGREGPIAQIGGGFGSSLAQKLKLPPEDRKNLVLSGVAAGISASFNAPIGGILFALEVIRRDNRKPPLIPLIVSSVVGTAIGIFFLGPAFSFNFPTELRYESPVNIPFFIILGILTGIFSVIWIKGFYLIEDIFDKIQKKLRVKSSQIIITAFGGLLVGLISVILYLSNLPLIYWISPSPIIKINAIQTIDIAFTQEIPPGLNVTLFLIIILFVASFLATAFTLGAGGSGGIFAPTLYLGTMVGLGFGIVLDYFGILQVDIALFAVLGMAGLFAGSSRAPLTAIIITAEMVGDFLIIIPLMLTVATSWFLSKSLYKNDVFVVKLFRRGVVFKKDSTNDILDRLTVNQAMTSADKIISISTKNRLEEVLDLVRNTKHEGFPVIEDGKLIGIVTLSDIHTAIESNPKNWNVGNILENKPVENRLICISKTAPLTHAVAIMERRKISRLPVVEKIENEQIKLIGWLTNHDITHAFISAKASSELDKIEEYFVNYPDIIK